MKKKLFKYLNLCIVFILIFSSTQIALAQNIYNDIITKVNDNDIELSIKPNDNIDIFKLPDDQVVLIIEDIPIYAKELKTDIKTLKEQSIKEKIINIIKKDDDISGTPLSSPRSSNYESQCSFSVAEKYRNKTIYVSASLSTLGYYQEEKHIYLPNRHITKYVDSYERNNRSTFISTLISFIPGLSNVYSIATEILSSHKYQNIDTLRRYRNSGSAAAHHIYKSQYASLDAISTWDKKTIKGKNYSSNDRAQVKYRVSSIKYGV